MGKYKKLIEEHLDARIAKHKVGSDVLGTLRGEVETFLKGNNDNPDSVVEHMAKKMVKSLESVGGEQAQIEMEILHDYVPQTLSKDQIKSELDTLDFSSKPNVGAKMGAAMKHFKGKAVDGNDVKEVILKHYN